MCLYLSISETLVGTLEETIDMGFVLFEATDCEEAVDL